MAFAVVFGAFGAVSDTTAEKLGSVSAGAEDEDSFEYAYEEDIYGNEALFITKYTGSSADVTIPAILTIEGEKVEVYGISETAFSEDTKIQTLKIDTDVNRIKCGAFRGCTSLKSVEFVKGKNDIEMTVEARAFDGCTSLKSVIFPEVDDTSSSILYLQDYAFLNCKSLKSVTVPSYVDLCYGVPVFGYETTDDDGEQEFEYLGDGKYETDLKQTEGFVMKCYSRSSAHLNCYTCGLKAELLDAPASADELTKAVQKADAENPNYSVKMTAQSYTADRVNNLGEYIDVIDEYYIGAEAKECGTPAAAVHNLIDPKTGKTVIEHATAFPYTLYDPTYSDGVFSISCFGGSHSVHEVVDLMNLLDKKTHLVKDMPGDGVALNNSTPLYYGTDGKLLFEHEYITGDAMVNGYAYVATKNVVGSAAILDKTGKVVLELPASFGRTGRGGHGGGMLFLSTSYSYYSSIEGTLGQGLLPFYSQYKHEGKTIFDAPCEQDDFDWAADGDSQSVTNSNTCGYIDLKGNIVIPQSFSQVGEFTEDGLAWAGKNMNIEGENSYTKQFYGYIDTKGETVIPFEYEDAYSFDSGYAVVMKNGKFGMIDTENKQAVSFKYEYIKGQQGGFMTAKLDGKWGIVDKYDNVVVPFMFEDVSLCIDGAAYGVSDGKVYRFDISEPVKGLLGDVNNDEKIDVEDAVKIINHINGVTPLTEDQMIRADVDHNSVIDIQDAVKVINHVNGLAAIVQPS